MNLRVSLIEGASYSSEASSLPFIYAITFHTRTVVVGDAKVTGCMLVNTSDSEVMAGYGRTIFSLPRTDRTFEVGETLTVEADALEYEEATSDLIPGEYELSAQVALQVRGSDGRVRHEELRASRLLMLS